MAYYFQELVILTGALTLVLVFLVYRYRKDIERRKVTEAQLLSREEEYRRLLASAERQTQTLKLLDEARNAMARELDLPTMLRMVVEAIAETFGYTQVSLYLIEGDNLVMQSQVGYDSVITHIPIDKGVSGRAVRSGKPILLEDVRSDPTFLGAIEGIASEICIPLFDRGKVAGTLNVESIQGQVLIDADLQLMTALSDHINIAITRSRLYTQISESEARYRSVVENINEIIFQIGPDGRLVFLNPAWSQVTGHQIKESIGTQISLYIHPDDRRQHTEQITGLLERKKHTIQYECRYTHRDGGVHWTEVKAQRVENGDNQIVGVFGTISDITERKQMDEERLRLSKLEAIGPLAGGIAHDFNNILTGIMGHISFAQLLLKPDEDGLLKARLEMAERAAMEAQKITRQLLTFSKGGAPVRQISSLREIIYEAAMFVSRGSNVRCDFHISDDLWPGDVDSGQIGQVLQNLILNAQQAMPNGGVVSLSAKNIRLDKDDSVLRLEAGAYLTIAVRDEGIGIPKNVLPKIFDPYFTTKASGTGLGLATAHSIITNHNGAIVVDSVVGKGTTFTLYLPASLTSAITNREEEHIHYQGAGKILVMEDERVVRNLLGEILKHCGYSATLTLDGVSAIEAYTTALETGKPYDAVIMDLTIPGGMGGKEAVTRILDIDPKAKVIASSGYSNDPVMANYREFGFTGIIPKPYKTTQLSKILHTILSEEQPEAV